MLPARSHAREVEAVLEVQAVPALVARVAAEEVQRAEWEPMERQTLEAAAVVGINQVHCNPRRAAADS